jgi:hypothetical protein
VASVALTKDEWAVVQEALDAYYYEVEHTPPGGIRPPTKARNAARREHLLRALPAIDVAIARQAAVGPLFGE